MVRTWIIPYQIHPKAFHIKPSVAFAPEFYSLLQDDLIYEALSRISGKRVPCISHRSNIIEHLSRLSCLPKSRQSFRFYIVKRRCSDVDIIPLKESQILELSAHIRRMSFGFSIEGIGRCRSPVEYLFSIIGAWDLIV